ncbi:hypothetical protein GCM10011392_24190 [Wenxinia marina]|nr:hypothetical protein GCM10011392_24190 [Wenxinia marina]
MVVTGDAGKVAGMGRGRAGGEEKDGEDRAHGASRGMVGRHGRRARRVRASDDAGVRVPALGRPSARQPLWPPGLRRVLPNRRGGARQTSFAAQSGAGATPLPD